MFSLNRVSVFFDFQVLELTYKKSQIGKYNFQPQGR